MHEIQLLHTKMYEIPTLWTLQWIEKSIIYVANITNRDLVIKTLDRFWFPQCNPEK